MNTTIVKTVLIVIICLVSSFPQKKEETVATVGNEKISVLEFRKKFELMPHISQNNDLPDSVKHEFLYSLIAEKLWAKEAEALGYDTLPLVKYTFEPLEKLYVKDALYKEEVDKKVKISNEDIIRGVYRKGVLLKLNIISSADSSEIISLTKTLNKGASFDSLLMLRPEYKGQEEPLEIIYGQMEDEKVEDIIYNLKPGEISKPVKTKSGWFLFKLKDKIVKSGTDTEKLTSEVKRHLRERRGKVIGQKFLAEFLSNAKAKINSSLFYRFNELVFNIMAHKEISKDSTLGDWYYLTEADLNLLVTSLGTDSLSENLVVYENGHTTLKEFIYYLMFEGFRVASPENEVIASSMHKKLNAYIEQELLYKEGIKRGYLNSPEVKEELRMWKGSYAAQMLRNQFLDSTEVSDDEALSFFNKKLNRPDSVKQVNIIEILTGKLEIIEIVLDEVKKGADFKELAAKYTEREWTKENKGEFGLFPVTMHGEIGRAAAKMNAGEIYGPLKVPEGYSIFKLIDRKEPEVAAAKTFDEMKNQIRNDIKSTKLENSMDNYTVKLAQKYGVEVNEQALKDIKVTNINMFTYRVMGFGGKIAATPYISPFYKWSKKLNTPKENL